MDEEQQEEKRVVGRDRSKAARGRGGKSQSSARLFSTLWPSSLGVNLMRHNGGEHEIPRFSLIRPQWRFPDKPGRSLFFFLRAAHQSSAVLHDHGATGYSISHAVWGALDEISPK